MLTPRTHAELIDELQRWSNGRIQTKSFHRTFHPYLVADEDPRDIAMDELTVDWLKEIFPYVPDAFKILRRLRVVTLYEVEVSYPIPHRKMLDTGNFALHLIPFDWHVRLVRVDRYGRYRVEDINELAAASVADQDARRRRVAD